MKKRNTLISLLAVAAFVATTDTVSAQCKQFLEPHVEWLTSQSKGRGSYSVRLVFVSLASTQAASYGEAILTLNASFTFLTGIAEVYKAASGTPFSPNKTPVAITIDVNTGKVGIGSAVITDPQCSNLLMYGFASTGWAKTYYVLSLADLFLAAPK